MVFALRHLISSSAVALLLLSSAAYAQQVPDTEFKPKIEKTAFAEGKGPVVLLDEAHFNFHTASGRYQTFANLLRRDGYVVKASTAKFSKDALKSGQILVIANALNESNKENWSPPNPSAFTDAEVAAVREWVNAGGALLLIADHLPFPGAAGKLAEAFGIHFNNGYAMEPKLGGGPLAFSKADGSKAKGSLLDHPITQGRTANESVDAVVTFTGSAFQVDKGEPVLKFSDDAMAFMPKTFGEAFTNDTAKTPIKGWLQGATIKFGKGRVAVFGEAAMFSAQLAGPNKAPMGMNAPAAKQNPQFLLNVLHWLSGLLDK
ncbi:MAG TPA: DUF4350 domain-containing protein [Blastocatellia bacterium]|nr:DUF4350 domain-containing protein [Blastocatellia bacterium]HMV85190.1 DUF4350 domain-containing protein [Blastocatellia bacterium]HMX24797.1 DUF4350 domain-containing protein [Blastocatellia bacterium]HMZ18443.1 DUF4350 domain-containing protein [Blastocatellia bacterium]HNG28706.1 DUF4350 domain-containing protein [Blastocatellia bacterium]